MTTETVPVPVTEANTSPRPRRRWRLRVLLALNVLLLGLFGLSQMTPEQLETLGPPGKAVSGFFHRPAVPETSAAGQRLIGEVKALGGDARVTRRDPGFLGVFGGSEQFAVALHGYSVTDKTLEHVVKTSGDRIVSLSLADTSVTDAGLRHLGGLSQLHQLNLAFMRGHPSSKPKPVSRITDAGFVHLGALKGLTSLSVNGLPISDAGLDELKNLPGLISLYLFNTKVKGTGLAGLASLPKLVVVYLDRSEITDEGMKSLAGALNLQCLGLSETSITDDSLAALSGLTLLQSLDLVDVKLTGDGVKHLAPLRRLRRLDLRRTGVSNLEAIDALEAANPGLQVVQ